MRTIRQLALCLSLTVLIATTAQSKEWRGIVPLRSTRADVERLLGKPNAKYDRYDFQNERVEITYSSQSCTEGAQWNVPPETVTQISIVPKQKLRLADLKLDPNKYKRIEDPHVQAHSIIWNEEDGVQYVVFEGGGEDDGMVLEIYYKPSAEDAHLRCPTTSTKKSCGSSPKY